MSHYQLSSTAYNDITTLLEDTAETHSQQHAIAYLAGLEQRLLALADNPHSGKARNEIRSGLRCKPYRQHIIFYRIDGQWLRVIRVLHGKRDLHYLMR